MLKKRILQFVVLLGIVGLGYFSVNSFKMLKEKREWEEYVAGLVHTASPQVEILKDTILVDYLNKKRTLSIYLPKAYHTDTLYYPVLYFLDGQSLFDEKILEGEEWQLDEVLDSLGFIGGKQAIVVGVYNSEDRITEYKPYVSTYYPDEVISGVEHAKWISTDVKAWIDNRYRTISDVENTYIGGASLGELMAYYMIATHSDIYGGAFVFSPSFWVSDKVYELHKKINNLTSKKIYINAGQLESPTVDSVLKMVAILREEGMTNQNVMVKIEKGEGHEHMAWRKGFKKSISWMLN